MTDDELLEQLTQAHMKGYHRCCGRDASYSEARADCLPLAKEIKSKFNGGRREHPVLPQKILKLDWGHRAVATAPVVFADTDNARFEQRINDLKRKQDEIIDVINDMKGVDEMENFKCKHGELNKITGEIFCTKYCVFCKFIDKCKEKE